MSTDETEDERPSKKKRVEKPIPVTPDATNPDLTEWMETLFDGEYPGKLTLVQLVGRTPPLARGDQIDSYDFLPAKRTDSKPTEKPSKEFFVSLSNRFITAAQRDCDMLQKQQKYGVEPYNSIKGADPYARYPLLLQPKRFYLEDLKKHEEDDEGNAEWRDRYGSDKLLRRMDQNDKAEEWRTEQFSTSIGGMFKFLENAAIRSQDNVDRLMSRNFELFTLLEKALSGQADRELALEKQRFWLEQMKDGAGLIKGMLPQFVNKFAGQQVMPQRSTEAIVLENFLKNCKPEQKEAAFGRWTTPPQGEEPQLIAQGLFTVRQMLVISGIIDGKMNGDEIDLLIPPGEDAITPEQMMGAQQIFTMSQLMPLQNLIMERMEKRAKAAEETKK